MFVFAYHSTSFLIHLHIPFVKMSTSRDKQNTTLGIYCDSFVLAFQVMESEQMFGKVRTFSSHVKYFLIWFVSHQWILAMSWLKWWVESGQTQALSKKLIFPSSRDHVLAKMGTKQIIQWFHESLAVNSYFKSGPRIEKYYFSLLQDSAVTVAFINSRIYLQLVSETDPKSLFLLLNNMPVPISFEVLLSTHVIDMVHSGE